MKNDEVAKISNEGTLIPAAPGFALLIPDEERGCLLSWPVIAWRVRSKEKSVGAVTVDGGCLWLDFAFEKTDDDTGLRQPDGSVLAQGAQLENDETYWEWVTHRSLRGLKTEELKEMGLGRHPR